MVLDQAILDKLTKLFVEEIQKEVLNTETGSRSAILGQLRQFLKDNTVTIPVGEDGKGLGDESSPSNALSDLLGKIDEELAHGDAES